MNVLCFILHPKRKNPDETKKTESSENELWIGDIIKFYYLMDDFYAIRLSFFIKLLIC